MPGKIKLTSEAAAEHGLAGGHFLVWADSDLTLVAGEDDGVDDGKREIHTNIIIQEAKAKPTRVEIIETEEDKRLMEEYRATLHNGYSPHNLVKII